MTPKEAAAILADGGLVIFPTETLWSLSCRADDEAAVQRLRDAKARPEAVPLAIGFTDPAASTRYADWTPGGLALAARFLPGPLSIIVPTTQRLPVVPGLDAVSIRIPDHTIAQAVLAACPFPVAMTSANRHGDPDPGTEEQVQEAMPGIPVVPGEIGGRASTVVDATGDDPKIVREGVISEAEVRAAWP